MCNTVKPVLVDTRGTLPNSGIAPHSLDVLLFSKLIDLPFGMILPTGCITAREIQSTFGCDFNQNKLSIYLSLRNQEPKNPVGKKTER